ncbi:MAG TPA: alpha-amylase family glycosyl hydrolase [Anaerolineales bacterium]|nr:alpha-amylase family glycosyl hydrolase [Anaerolineales bacterium]
MQTPEERIQKWIDQLYGAEQLAAIWSQFEQRLQRFQNQYPYLQDKKVSLSQRDAWLITYGDQIQEAGQPPLKTLAAYIERHLGRAINRVHLLPFFPYSSDDGFSVIAYDEVDPQLGTWEDIARIDRNFRLMVDAVINHISQESLWFQKFKQGYPDYTAFFLVLDPSTDVSQVVRPRALPLLTPVKTKQGEKCVWTTFSADQIDLNYANPQVLLEITELLLQYAALGAEIIRLDAIAYLWKDPATASIHLPQTHAVVKLWRAVLDAAAPGVMLITETNVPHAENISYFGELLAGGEITDEAQLVYQFPLAPLTLHAFISGQADRLNAWAAGLETPSPKATFLNFIASHDGIGVRPAEGLLSPDEIQALVARTQAHGGEVSYKTNADGSQSVYELNITLYDFLNDPAAPQAGLDVRRFLAAQVIMLSLAGVPGIYFHSLIGARNCQACKMATGRARSLNREKFERQALEAALDNPESHTAQVFYPYLQLLETRCAQPAFHPAAAQKFPAHDNPAVFAILRQAEDSVVLCLVNVSDKMQRMRLDLDTVDLSQSQKWADLIGQANHATQDGRLELALEPYAAMWLTPGE